MQLHAIYFLHAASPFYWVLSTTRPLTNAYDLLASRRQYLLLPLQISKQYTQFGAALLFFVFGFKMLYEVFTAVEKVRYSHMLLLLIALKLPMAILQGNCI